ncbi:MAG: TSUP family transporter, partial [Actinobacteria bacterium]|nr:TSUP family transporter [Actinomycetota bacterium]
MTGRFGRGLSMSTWQENTATPCRCPGQTAYPQDNEAERQVNITRTTLARDLALGIGAGLISGFFGVGGGIIVVPIMVIGLHFAQKKAQATSLVMISFGGVAGVTTYALAQNVAWLPALFIVLGSLAGAWIGAQIVQKLPDQKLQIAFGVLLILIALRMFFSNPSDGGNELPAITALVILGYLASGFAMGIFSAMLGVGGGILLIPILIFFFGFSQLLASGTSLAVMIPTALLAATRLTRAGLTNWPMGIRLGAGAV